MSMRRKRFKRCLSLGTIASFVILFRKHADWNLLGSRTMLITRSDDGYFVEEHCLTEDGQAVAHQYHG